MIRNVFHFCIIFPGLLFFSVWPLQMEVIMHRGRCVFKKKDWIQLPYPSTFPNTPCFLWGRGFVVTLPNRDVAPSPRQDLREARSRVYSTQLTRSIWSYCFGGHADCNVCRVAESWALAVSWLLRLWTLSLCLSLRALISNCPWGTLITLLNPSAATRLTTHLFCSFFPWLSIISQSNLKGCFCYRPVKPGIFSPLQTPVTVWMHLTKSYE